MLSVVPDDAAQAELTDEHGHRLGKETIKEALFDTLGTGDRAWSRRLGAASYGVLLAMLGEVPAAVAVSKQRIGAPSPCGPRNAHRAATFPLVGTSMKEGTCG